MKTQGFLCYADQWDSYVSECYDKNSETNWILINPFDVDKSSALMNKLNITDAMTDKVTGLIFDLD